MDFSNYYLVDEPSAIVKIKFIDDINKSYPLGTYSSERGSGGNYIFIPQDSDEERQEDNPNLIWDNRYTIIYDDPNDNLYLKTVENPLTTPEWD